MFSIILHNPYITLLYLYGHGFYKSLNFMCAGNLIQWNNNYQDVRAWGNLFLYYPFEFFFFFLIGIFNLGGLPFY